MNRTRQSPSFEIFSLARSVARWIRFDGVLGLFSTIAVVVMIGYVVGEAAHDAATLLFVLPLFVFFVIFTIRSWWSFQVASRFEQGATASSGAVFASAFVPLRRLFMMMVIGNVLQAIALWGSN